jgi:hypothetical protein
MIQEAEYFKAQDMKFKERAKAINALDTIIFTMLVK